jgi:UDP-N-acetylmuramyl pentapeptide phosphotransferase/UDP-N-acetylglucosamine-1-phosphate transferase
MMDELSKKVTLTACYTLSVILLSMVGVMLIGFFDARVDNSKIFEIVGPAFQTIVGGFIGLITGIKIGSHSE